MKADRVQVEMRPLPNWKVKEDPQAIQRTYELPTFRAAIAFVGYVAELAEAADHHPDIEIRYSKVTLTLTSRDAGELTDRDIALARQIDGFEEGAVESKAGC